MAGREEQPGKAIDFDLLPQNCFFIRTTDKFDVFR